MPIGRPRTPLTPQQAADLAELAAGNISRRHLNRCHRWRDKRAFRDGKAAALQRLEERWQDELLAAGSHVDIARYAGLLTTAGPVQRLKFLRGAIWRAQHDAELAGRGQKLPTWRQVAQQVYAETNGLLRL